MKRDLVICTELSEQGQVGANDVGDPRITAGLQEELNRQPLGIVVSDSSNTA